MINLVTFKWDPPAGKLHPRKGIAFGAQHVNRLYSMLSRHISEPFQLTCITDKIMGIREEVRCVPLWNDLRDMGGCYTRLKLFSPEMAELIGEDFFSIDLDTLILKDITSLLEGAKAHEFKAWGDTNPTTPYNGSFFYMKAGARKQVWEKFHKVRSPEAGRQARHVGTDQAWIGACLGPNEAKWTKADGVYSYRCHFKMENRYRLNGEEKIIFFHGSEDPSKPETQKQAPWIAQHWQ